MKKDEAAYTPIESSTFNLPRIFEMIPDDILLTTIDISELLSVHPETVRRWCRTGKIRIYTPGGQYKIQGIDLKEFLYRWYLNKGKNR